MLPPEVAALFVSNLINLSITKVGRFLVRTSIVISLLLFFISPACAESTTIKIGVLAMRGYDHALSQWGETANYLNQKIPGQRFELIPLDFEEVRLATMSRRIDFLITNSSYYVALETDQRLKLIATMKNLHDDMSQQRFGGVIFTRADRKDIETLQDTAGKVFWAVDRNSLGGWLAAWREFYARGMNPEGDFRLLEFVGTHDAVVFGVLDGLADAGTVRTDTLERMASEGLIDLADFKILNPIVNRSDSFLYLHSTRLYPEWPFAVLSHVPTALVTAVTRALLEMPADAPAATAAKISGWTEPLDYQPIHDLLREWHMSLYERHVGSYTMGRLVHEYWPATSVLALVIFLLIVLAIQKTVLTRRLEQQVRERTRELYREVEERKVVEDRLYRAEKMEAIGMMAGGVAHDLNNILSGVVSYPELLLRRLPDESELREPLRVIRESGIRAADVVADLLTVSRDATKVRSMANINTLVLEYMQSPEQQKISSVHPQVTVRLDLAEGLESICCSPTHVKKCLMNLILNAAEAIGTTGHIDVSTCTVKLSEAEAQTLGIEEGEYLALSVADCGGGISATDLEHIFEPFYTTKEMGRSGTGLGLAVIWNSMLDHGGTVTVKSDPGGSIFTLYFPARNSDCNGQSTKADVKEKKQLQKIKGEGKTSLVVDDEAVQRTIALDILKEFGYRGEAVASGEAAIEYLKRKRVDLVLLDMVMRPGMNGFQTLQRIKEMYPGQKAIIASGFSESKDVKLALEQGAGEYVKKPYTLERLGDALQRELAR